MNSTEAIPGRKARRTANVLVVLVVLFLLFSASCKLLHLAEVDESFDTLGLPRAIRLSLGWLELLCTLAYAVPRTRSLGAILLTGYLGGAIVTHWRVGDPLASHTLFPLYLGALMWTGVLLCDTRLRAALLAPLLPRSRSL